jgi:filamentous hemagglutinin family protein
MLSKVVRSLSFGILSLFAWGQFTKPTIAQADIRPDNTLPGESSIVENQGTLTFIEGGATRGSNLFHSFEEFNIRTGEGAYFLVPNLAIESVFSRITGNDPTNIDGVLGAAISRESGIISGANLYLMNPNGILFGPNASLDLGGSFIATTSDAIQFGTQGSFGSDESATPSDLLQINPTAFLFGSSPGTITNQSVGRDADANSATRGLGITPGNTLILVGGDVNLEGGQITVPNGHVQIAAVASNGIVDFNAQANEFFLVEIPASMQRGNVSLSDGSIINVQGNTGGNIDIMARNINIANRSSLITNVVSAADASNAQTGTINLDATDQIIIEQRGAIFNNVMANATGNAGNVNIRANTFILDGFGSAITTSNFGEGNAGAISINANTVRIDQGNLFSRIPDGRDGNAGNIEINANSILLSEAFLTTANRGTGNGGDITFNTGNLIATNGSNLTASIFGTGTSGNITLNTLGSVVLDGFRFDENGEKLRTAIFTNIEENGNGQAGDIRINADSISLTNEAALYSNVREGGNGSGGNIFINGRTLAVADGAELNANMLGQGIAGNILINLTGDVFFNGGDAFSNIGPNVVDTSAGGNIETNANSL